MWRNAVVIRQWDFKARFQSYDHCPWNIIFEPLITFFINIKKSKKWTLMIINIFYHFLVCMANSFWHISNNMSTMWLFIRHGQRYSNWVWDLTKYILTLLHFSSVPSQEPLALCIIFNLLFICMFKSLVWHPFCWTSIYYCLGVSWSPPHDGNFLASLKTYWWSYAVFCFLEGLFSLWNNPRFLSLFIVSLIRT